MHESLTFDVSTSCGDVETSNVSDSCSRGVGSAEWGARSGEWGVGSAEWGVGRGAGMEAGVGGADALDVGGYHVRDEDCARCLRIVLIPSIVICCPALQSCP